MRGRKAGFKHSEETKQKMREARKKGIESDLELNENPENVIEVPAAE